jgi:hypothetical protein
MKISKNRLREIVKEVIKEESEYQEFFKRALEKTGKSIPQMSDEEKKAFFDKIEAAWKGKGEKNEGNAFGAAVSQAKEEGDDSFEVGGKTFKVKEATMGESELPNVAIPSSVKTKLNLAIDKIKDSKLTYPQKLQVVGKIIDSLGVDKQELTKMSSRLRGTLESVVNEAKVIVYNEKTGERYEVLSGKGKGDLFIAMKALQKVAPSHMKYSIKESVVKEGASSEELRMAKNAIKNFARYRRVPGEQAIYDLMRALKDVEREYKQKKK